MLNELRCYKRIATSSRTGPSEGPEGLRRLVSPLSVSSRFGCDPSLRARLLVRRSFTLVEVLVVIAIIALIATISIGALMVMPQRAKVRATEALIAKLDVLITQKIEAIQKRQANIAVTSVDMWLAGNDLQRAKVIAITRVMRQELPERFALSYPAPPNKPFPLHGPANNANFPVLGDWSQIDLSGSLDSGGPAMAGPSQLPVELPTASRLFAAAMKEVVAQGSFARHDPKATRAEALYLIITGSGSGDAGAEFGPNEVGDTDFDGLKEFLDAFGNPIQFFLFPTHYTSAGANRVPKSNSNDSGQLLTQLPPAVSSPPPTWWSNVGAFDRRTPFERLFHSVSQPCVPFLAWRSSIPTGMQPRSYGYFPMIISAGPDGGFGLALGPGADGQPGGAGTDDDGKNGTDDIGELGWPGTDDNQDIEFGAALRISNPAVEGYGQDLDNVDNHTLRAR